MRILKWGGIGFGGLIGLVVILVIIGTLADTSDDPENSTNEDRVDTPTEPTRTPEPEATPVETPSATPEVEWLDDVIKESILDNFRSETLVNDAAITRDDETVSLALIVNPAIDESYAKQLGDNFVRQVKSLSDDNPPGKDIGTGKYEYLITIAYGDQVLYQGAKSRGAVRITW